MYLGNDYWLCTGIPESKLHRNGRIVFRHFAKIDYRPFKLQQLIRSLQQRGIEQRVYLLTGKRMRALGHQQPGAAHQCTQYR